MKTMLELFDYIREACEPLRFNPEMKFSFSPTKDKKAFNVFVYEGKNFYCILHVVLNQSNPLEFPMVVSCPNDALIPPVELKKSEELDMYIAKVDRESLYIRSVRKLCRMK